LATQGQRNAVRLVPLAGVVFVVLAVVSLFVAGEPPDADDSVREVIEYYDDHEASIIVGSVLEGLGAVALLFFAASLRRAIRREERGSGGVLSVVALAGGVVAAAGIGTDAAIRFALADVATDIEPAAAQSLNALWSDFFFPMAVGIGALVLATGLAGLRTRVIPTWLAWVSFLIFVAMFTPAGPVAFLVSAVWVVIVSILLWRREVTAPTGAATVGAG
jgi:hypothetical protein